MGFDAIVVLGVLALVLGLLVFTRLPADAVMMGGLTLLVMVPVPDDSGWKLGVIDFKTALAGFSNEGLITVAVLFVVVAGLRSTGGVDFLAQRLLGRPRTTRGAVARVFGPACVMSTFLNNTPVVAMFIPAVSDWSKKLRIPASKLLIPLSYSAILGGTCSLIGTSTNLVVAGMVIASTDLAPLRMFDITWIGVPCALIGGAFLILLAPKLLPARQTAAASMADPREYIAEMIVPPHSPLAGKTVEQAGLRSLPGCYLVEIERGGEIVAAVGPEHEIRPNDRLVFAGIVESIKELQNLRGLAPATNQVFKLDSPRHRRRLIEVVVSDTCPIVGRTIREGRFRTMYQAAVLAVARNGQRLQGKIGDIELQAGDMLLLEAHPSFEQHYRDSRDFFLIKTVEDSEPRRHDKALLALAVLVAMVLAASLEWLSMLQAAMLAAGAMIMARCCSLGEARRSVDLSTLVVIAAALAFGSALEQSGAATTLAQGAVRLAGTIPTAGPQAESWVALAAIYLVTALLTELITNNAAVALTFPIAHATAQQLDANFLPFVFAVMMAGSASFATPIGYQTNLMVYGPGGYTFGDFLRIGIPLNLLMAATSITLIPMIWGF